jgi:membrane protein
MIKLIQNIKGFLLNDIWRIRDKSFSSRKSILIRSIRVVLLAFRGFKEDRILLRASALTYFSALSVVPVAAMAFGIAKGFGFEKRIREEIEQNFEGHKEVMEWVIRFSENLLANINEGLIAGIGVAILLWSVMRVLSVIEGSFNDIWQVIKPRPLSRKFSDYLSLMILAPVLIILSSGLNVFIQQFASITAEYQLLAPFVKSLLKILPVLVIWILFAIIYIVMPNTRVKVKNAIIPAIIAGSLFQLLQWGYIEFQVGVSRYSAIYGSFAALPLFLIFLQLSWQVVLFGAELSFAHQNVDDYAFEEESLKISHSYKRVLTLMVVHHIVRLFAEGKYAPTPKQITKNLDIPVRLVRNIIDLLLEAGVLSELATDDPKVFRYQPAFDINKISVSSVVEKLDHLGENDFMPEDNKALKAFNQINKDYYDLLRKSSMDKLIKDI